MSNANTFGARLIRAREEKEMTRAELAEVCSMHPSQLGYYENDKRKPSPNSLNKLACALGVDKDWLWYGDAGRPADADPSVEYGTPFSVRVPSRMRQKLEGLAIGAQRSLSAEILHRLAQTLGEDFAAEQPEAQPVLAEMLGQMREQTGYLRELVELARAANPRGQD